MKKNKKMIEIYHQSLKIENDAKAPQRKMRGCLCRRTSLNMSQKRSKEKKKKLEFGIVDIGHRTFGSGWALFFINTVLSNHSS